MPPQTQRGTQPPSKVATLLIKQLTNHTGSHIGMLGSQTSVATKPKATRQPLDWSANAQPHSQQPAVQPASRPPAAKPAPGSCSQAATEPARHLPIQQSATNIITRRAAKGQYVEQLIDNLLSCQLSASHGQRVARSTTAGQPHPSFFSLVPTQLHS